MSLDEPISKNNLSSNKDSFGNPDKEENNEQCSNCESLKGLILNVSTLHYNGFELQDPTALMTVHFNAYIPNESDKNSR